MFQVELTQLAISSVQNSYEYYEEKSAGLGLRFLNEIEKAVESLEINPFYQKRYDDIRCYPVHIFPFLIHFIVLEEKNVVRIYDILHTSFDTSKWL